VTLYWQGSGNRIFYTGLPQFIYESLKSNVVINILLRNHVIPESFYVSLITDVLFLFLLITTTPLHLQHVVNMKHNIISSISSVVIKKLFHKITVRTYQGKEKGEQENYKYDG
jgi:hypothetical protein